MNHSPRLEKLGMQLDFQGVILLMWGATVPLIYYGFYCDKNLQWIYWSLVRPSPTFAHFENFILTKSQPSHQPSQPHAQSPPSTLGSALAIPFFDPSARLHSAVWHYLHLYPSFTASSSTAGSCKASEWA